MDVSHHCDRRLDVNDIALLHQQLLRFGTYCLNDRVGEQFLLVQPRYTLIEVDRRWQVS